MYKLYSVSLLGDYGPLPDPSPKGRETAQSRLQGSTRQRPRGFFNPQMAFDWHKEQSPEMPDEQIWKTIRFTHRTNWDGILVPKTDPEISWLTGRTALKEGPFLWECVGKILCRTLVMRGEISTVLDVEQAQKMAETIPNGNGSFQEVPGVGHGLHNEDMDATIEIVREFFDR